MLTIWFNYRIKLSILKINKKNIKISNIKTRLENKVLIRSRNDLSARNYLIDPISPCRRIQLIWEDTLKKRERKERSTLTGYEMKLSIYSSPKKKRKKEQGDAYTSLKKKKTKKKKKKKILLLLPPFITYRTKFRRPKKSPPRGISCWFLFR